MPDTSPAATSRLTKMVCRDKSSKSLCGSNVKTAKLSNQSFSFLESSECSENILGGGAGGREVIEK